LPARIEFQLESHGVPGQVIAAAMPDKNDPAAVFACALSLHTACMKAAERISSINLSEAYEGGDQFMREMMRVAELFEAWACEHVAFDALNYHWPYLLEERFGNACLTFMAPSSFAEFDRDDCFRVAFRLRLPIWADLGVPVPVRIDRMIPNASSTFRAIRIRTVRDDIELKEVESFVGEDDPFDKRFGKPYFGIYGLDDDGTFEHITDRDSYQSAKDFVWKLFPGIEFPERAIGFQMDDGLIQPESALPITDIKSVTNTETHTGFCIYIDTLFQGPVPVVSDGDGKPVVFATELEAQREVAAHQMIRLRQFLDEERDFDDAMTQEEYVVPVTVHADGVFPRW